MVKDQYLYLHSLDFFFRINLSKLREHGYFSSSSPPSSSLQPPLENLIKFSDLSVPIGMGCMIVDSKVYMIGGEIVKKGGDIRRFGDMWNLVEENNGLNRDVFVFDPTQEKGPFVPLCDGPIPRMIASKTCPIVATIGQNIYVLSTMPQYASRHLPRPRFEVFNSVEKTWKQLPDPPFFGANLGFAIISHFVYGHNLFVCTTTASSIFDAKKEVWVHADGLLDQVGALPPTCGAAEFDGVVVSPPLAPNCESLIAYRFDADGILRFHRVLDELSVVFQSGPYLSGASGFVSHLADGHMCFLLSGYSPVGTRSYWFARVAMFKVFVSAESWDGISVVLEGVETFDFSEICHYAQCIDSAFVLSEDSKKRGVEHMEADATFKKAKSTLTE